MLIEILDNVYYDTEKSWYKQNIELIKLGLDIEKTKPFNIETEKYNNNFRVLMGEWRHETNKGYFQMIVNIHYLYSIKNNNFLTKDKQNTVIINKLADSFSDYQLDVDLGL